MVPDCCSRRQRHFSTQLNTFVVTPHQHKYSLFHPHPYLHHHHHRLQIITMASAPQTSKKFPGFGLPVEHFAGRCFPHAVAKSWGSSGVTTRELRMLGFINQITDKPNWEDKVFDDEIVSRWRAEADAHETVDGDIYMSKEMFDFCIQELKDKSEHYKKTGRVNVLDAELLVIKSDNAVSRDLQKELQEGVKVLEDVPNHKKDWHPGAEDSVLDLVHPSLFPVIWGVTRVLEEGTVPLENCIDYTGKGALTTAATKKSIKQERRWDGSDDGYRDSEDFAPKSWGSYQWLPAEVAISPDGSAKVTSYINNLHPVEHKKLYPVLERVVAATVPLWEDTFNGFADRRRIELKNTGAFDYTFPPGLRYRIPDREGPKSWYDPVKETYHDNEKGENGKDEENEDKEKEDEEEDEDKDEDENEYEDEDDDWRYEDDWTDWRNDNRILVQREPRDYVPQSEFVKAENLSKKIQVLDAPISLKNTSLQIIFKLANIYLSPENPRYEGGTWHVEGTLNEVICASAIYYYDQENITDSHLAFANTVDTQAVMMIPEQNEYSSLEDYLSVANNSSGMASKNIGQVLTSEGRLLTFPNCLRHQVQPFELKDKTKSGHRKILAMFLVDPNRPVLSSAHVPPQRRDWWADKVRDEGGLSGKKMPPEVFDMVVSELDDFPLSWKQAVEHREKLMEERGFMNGELDTEIEQLEFSFCEH
ncbi:hypothetical protein QBC38DRAFT_139315 [Podospora fimiseda]|uniref:Uncharacterized protein n=1 Tax=Podospora fimiseda TaxID=252190 RepID=A0AAN6YMN8_9PEZI|nr:hypothetical protein QBC38DRAFT_139315 [Podospora fimiseda]